MKTKVNICSVGAWHGRSSRALGDNLHENAILWDIDTWAGSEVEKETNHRSAKNMQGDAAYYEYMQNMLDLVQEGKVIPLRMSSKNAANFFKEKGILFDFIFIDAGHTYEEVCADIDAWKDLLTEDGIFCGHDFNAWAGVNQAVSDKLIAFNVGVGTTIWYCDKKNIHFDTPKVFDCFPMNFELDLLEKRLSKLWDVVDRFVICEAVKTHGNKSKTLNFNDNLLRFEKYLSKITYLVVENFPDGDSWTRERYQRSYLLKGLNGCKGNDICIISDLDEIPSIEAIKSYRPEMGIASLEMDLYYYNLQTKASDKWLEAKIAPYRLVRELDPCGIRYSPKDVIIKDGGQHLSYFGNTDAIIKKIEDSAHQENNIDKFKTREHIENAISQGKDLFDRPIKYEKIG